MTNGTDAQTHTPRPGACCMDCRAGYVSPRNAGSSWNIMQATTMPEGYGSVKEAAESTGLIVRSLGDQVKARAKNAGKQAQDLAGKLKEGPASIKILSSIGGAGLIVAGFFNFFGHLFGLRPISALVNVYMFLFGVMILVLEERIPIAPNNFLKFVHEYFAFATEVWGRGAFFFFVGTLAMAQWEFFDIVLGVYLMGLGAGMIFWGRNAYKNLDAVRLQLRDPDVVTAMFFQFDTNTNGVLEETELRELFKSLGAQMRPAEIEAAIMIMDRNNDGKVTLDEFQAWWKMRNPDMANAAAV